MFSNNYSLTDVVTALGGNEGGLIGGNSWWILILFLFFIMGGRGGFGLFGGNGGEVNALQQDGMLRSIQNGLCDGFYAMNTGMLNGFSGIQNSLCQGFSGIDKAIATTGYDLSQAINNSTVSGMQNTFAISNQLNNMAANQAACCCETQKGIERGFAETNYNLSSQACDTRHTITDNTRDIIDNNNANTRAILDFLTNDKIATLTAENQSLRFANSQQAQNAYLIGALKTPCPVPAYMVPNPNCCCPTM